MHPRAVLRLEKNWVFCFSIVFMLKYLSVKTNINRKFSKIGNLSLNEGDVVYLRATFIWVVFQSDFCLSKGVNRDLTSISITYWRHKNISTSGSLENHGLKYFWENLYLLIGLFNKVTKSQKRLEKTPHLSRKRMFR